MGRKANELSTLGVGRLRQRAQQEVLARSTGLLLRPIVDLQLARRTAEQIQGERVQSDLFFAALRRLLPVRL